MRVRQNIAELMGLHALRRQQGAYTQALTRMATGKRINRAADDPSGVIAAERLSGRQQALHKLISDTEFASHALSAREGGLQAVSDLLIELEGLVVAAANKGALGDAEREALQQEAASLVDGIEHVIGSATFNDRRILAETQVLSLGGTNQVLGALSAATLGSETQYETVEHPSLPGVRIARGGAPLGTVGLLDIRSGALNLFDGDLETALRVVDRARTSVGGLMGQVGSLQRYLVSTDLSLYQNELENTAAARSLIEDADIAEEASGLARAEVLAQATTAVILASRSTAERSLALLG